MRIDNNKADFEKALTEMKETIELLRHCVDDTLMESLDAVVTEYDGHYQGDIESMMNSNEDLQDKLNDLED